ncbi:hypothetical protein IQ250_22380, partial [Pseudanabaenaceae cyanobacterium LEGE 13415]|nr:hypothetical protein [Pseudanabaenaceae cyanobacterium LEGE 13415]
LYLEDDQGNRYPVVPPPDNTTVKVGGVSTAKGQFRFLGRINPKATKLTLRANPGDRTFGGNETSTPGFDIADIPVQR